MTPVESPTRIWNDSSTDSSVGGAICANCGFISVCRRWKSTPTSSDHDVDSSASRRLMIVRDSDSSMSVSSRRRPAPWPVPPSRRSIIEKISGRSSAQDRVRLERLELEDVRERRHRQRRDELAVRDLLGAQHGDVGDGAQRARQVRRTEAREGVVQHLERAELVLVELRRTPEVHVLDPHAARHARRGHRSARWRRRPAARRSRPGRGCRCRVPSVLVSLSSVDRAPRPDNRRRGGVPFRRATARESGCDGACGRARACACRSWRPRRPWPPGRKPRRSAARAASGSARSGP